MPKIKANGIELYYHLHGLEGGDTLVLSNGVLMSTAGWVYQVPILSQHFNLLLYDCRGMWGSEHPPGPYTMELHADDLAALLDALEIESAHIGGTSYGAELSMVFAHKYPERTRSLLLISAVSQIDPVLEGLVNLWLAAAEVGDPELFFKAVYPVTFSDRWCAENQPILDQALERYRSLDFNALIELFRCFLSFNFTEKLAEIGAPTLVIVGELDILKPRPYAEIIAQKIPNAEYAIIPGAAHAPFWEKVETFNSIVLGFLLKNAARGNNKELAV
ncbi:MAG: 3-oxoadipate enol-lactonase [Anaerolineae bacterium]|nr:MAG: 3-oxoadipate enol-lactonase [Anaerolineae bacterium]